jgi:hypothetical protein
VCVRLGRGIHVLGRPDIIRTIGVFYAYGLRPRSSVDYIVASVEWQATDILN